MPNAPQWRGGAPWTVQRKRPIIADSSFRGCWAARSTHKVFLPPALATAGYSQTVARGTPELFRKTEVMRTERSKETGLG